MKYVAAATGIILAALLGLLLLPFSTSEIAPGVTVISPRFQALGANMVMYDSGNGRLLVDTQLPLLRAFTRMHVGSLEGGDQVVITHWHPDHSGGISSFAGSADIWAHESTIRRLAEPQEGHHLTEPGSFHRFPARPEVGRPGRTAVDGQVLLGAKLKVYPGAHTDGDIVVHLPAPNVIVAGDLIWPHAFPFIDTHSGGTVSGLIVALDDLLAISNEATLFVPGHGRTLRRSEVVGYREMVLQTYTTHRCSNDPGTLAAWRVWETDLMPLSRWKDVIGSETGDDFCSQ